MVSQSKQLNMGLQLGEVQQQVKSLEDAQDMKQAGEREVGGYRCYPWQSLAGEPNIQQDVFKTGAGLRPSNGLCAVGNSVRY